MEGFSEKDLRQLSDKGISREKILNQIETFTQGIPFVKLYKAAVVSEGILKFPEKRKNQLIGHFEKSKKSVKLLKFVPASGAASRMFKALFNFLDTYDPEQENFEDYLKRTKDKDMEVFAEGLQKFPFYELVQARIKTKNTTQGEAVYSFVRELLSENGLNYGFFPKGLLPFHKYKNNVATPFEEHLKEGANYAVSGQNAKLHFTVSEQHEEMFHKEYNSVKDRVSKDTNTTFNLSYSYQKSSTDTLAVTLENTAFRNSDGSLFFRPGGHGALIENLNDQEADVIFIKNIDNVVVSEFSETVSDNKKILAGLLLEVQAKAFKYADLLKKNELTAGQMDEIKLFLEEELNVRFSDNFRSFTISGQIEVLKDKINRPIRVCGMVKNEGEPGGGPFWVKDMEGNVSLQIIESAQIDMENPQQESILKNATHFNPVDLVCGVKNHKGEKYNLLNFVDAKQGFITQKTKEGKALKALELPGLWNGAMAFWNTIFVEVPLITFNPVKTVNDLLKPPHQVR